MIILSEVAKQILSEGILTQDISDAILKKVRVYVNYEDEESHAVGRRLIEPYVYGVLTSGEEAVRVFQLSGSSYRGKPKWKLFLVNNIKSWQPTTRHFYMPPDKYGITNIPYNESGDKQFSQIYTQAKFDNPTDTLSQERLKTNQLKDMYKMDTRNIDYGDALVPQRAINTTKKQRDMIQRNLNITQQERERNNVDPWADYDKAQEELINQQQSTDDLKTQEKKNKE